MFLGEVLLEDGEDLKPLPSRNEALADPGAPMNVEEQNELGVVENREDSSESLPQVEIIAELLPSSIEPEVAEPGSSENPLNLKDAEVIQKPFW